MAKIRDILDLGKAFGEWAWSSWVKHGVTDAEQALKTQAQAVLPTPLAELDYNHLHRGLRNVQVEPELTQSQLEAVLTVGAAQGKLDAARKFVDATDPRDPFHFVVSRQRELVETVAGHARTLADLNGVPEVHQIVESAKALVQQGKIYIEKKPKIWQT